MGNQISDIHKPYKPGPGTNVDRPDSIVLQPRSELGFFNKISQTCICLEYVTLHKEGCYLRGFVRVSNLSYCKDVVVRWTENSWKTYRDTGAAFYRHHGETDTFEFKLPMTMGDVIFAIRYRSRGNEYWDNNGWLDYSVKSQQSNSQEPPSIDSVCLYSICFPA